MGFDELALGIGVVAAGVALIAWALFGETYDDRSERSVERFLEIGMRHDLVPMRRRDRVGGVIAGLVIVVGGIVFLTSR